MTETANLLQRLIAARAKAADPAVEAASTPETETATAAIPPRKLADPLKRGTKVLTPNHAGSEPLQPLLTAREAANLLRISERKLWQLTNCGEVPCVRLGRSVRYDARDLANWIEQNKRGGSG